MAHYITKESLEDLKIELKKITEIDLPKILEAINSAREEGDLRENAAYQTGLKVKDELTTRQQEIEEILKDYQIIDEDSKLPNKNNVVNIGNKVKIKYTDTDESFEIKIVGSSESDILSGKVSNESPIANAILGKKVNDSANFKSPSGRFTVKVLEIN